MHLNFWVTIQFPLAYQSKRLVIFPELRWSCGRIIILVKGLMEMSRGGLGLEWAGGGEGEELGLMERLG